MSPPPDRIQLPDAAHVEDLQQRLLAWYAEHGRDLPWRHTTDPYAVLVSEVMLQQTQVVRVVAYYEAWLATFPTIEALAESSLEQALRLWQGLGYNNRARRLRECAVTLAAGAAPGACAGLPRSLNALRNLPGIGPYTARAILVFAYNDDVAAVDANVRRVLTHELELPSTLGDRKLQAIADTVLPRGRSRDWHNALMDRGALVLTARATGVGPRTVQSRFQGSRRQKRARLLRALLQYGSMCRMQLAEELAIPASDVDEIVDHLSRDRLVVVQGDQVSVA